ncbi:HD domain-containing phosphohydrolase [Oceanobacillus profundus]|nr:HD domain-containing phosphohydrolase [Oceanobacillus profundus]MCM3397874.1 HD domain-containing protein [Oceanobacillus profundus]
MVKYNLQDLSSQLGKNALSIEKWFNELENKSNYYVPVEDDKKVFNEEDLKVATFISEKREKKMPFSEILKQVNEKFSLRQKEDRIIKDSSTLDKKELRSGGNDPEALFYEIAQDNEIIQLYKYHSLRVMFLSSALAKKVNCYNEDLRIAALLHDIGKMGVSKKILMKPGKLTELEYTIIQSHSHVGNVIVRKHLGLTNAARYIRDHHERWDGTGYPRRLLGDEITIQGRIISLCDAFDTMVFDQRNYKQRLSYEEAYEELERGSWKQFDGNLVKNFIEVLEDITIPEYMIQ